MDLNRIKPLVPDKSPTCVFYETTRDFARKYGKNSAELERLVLVHEMGHLVAQSLDENITLWDASGRNPAADIRELYFYTPEYLRRIRSATKPAGD